MVAYLYTGVSKTDIFEPEAAVQPNNKQIKENYFLNLKSFLYSAGEQLYFFLNSL